MHSTLLGILLPGMIAMAATNDWDHRAWIEHSYDAGRLLILPHVAAGHTARLRFELISTKSDAKGNASNTRQAGNINLKLGQVRSLSRVRLSVNQDDHYTLKLRVYENNQLVAEDIVTYPK